MIFWKLGRSSDVWPIYEEAGNPPEGWNGWPDRKKVALVLTHDIELAGGQEKCRGLMDLEESLGFRSSFYFVPERYDVSPELRHHLVSRGFEAGVHGLNHDGKLYRSRKEFQKRAVKIRKYLNEWGSCGFASPSMQHKLEWIHDLNVEYDISTYDTDPFEPQGGGTGTIFPFCVRHPSNGCHYVEIPYTLPQDFTLFVLMREKNVDIWKRKLDWIFEKGGMAHLKTHPDYMNFGNTKVGLEEYPVRFYTDFLEYIKKRYEGQYWHVLPKDLARFWSTSASHNTER